MEEVWKRRGYGTNVGQSLDGRRLTHVAFADDMTLVARSWLSLRRMVALLREALARRGLQLHPSKCKAQTNSLADVRRGSVQITPDFALTVLAEGECLEVLGTSLSLLDATKYEIEARVAIVWRKFWALKHLLLSPKVSRKRRLHLFDTTVGSSVLYGSHAWTPRADELRQLRAAQNRMLNRICQVPRYPEELLVDWLRRSTRKSRQFAEEAGVRDWVQAHARKKWLWAGHVARRPASTWLWKVSSWRDAEWNCLAKDGASRLLRPSRRRWMKWEDALRRFAAHSLGGSWKLFAGEAKSWNGTTEAFVQWFVGEQK